MRTWRFALLVVCAVCVLLPHAAAQSATMYVAPKGSDLDAACPQTTPCTFNFLWKQVMNATRTLPAPTLTDLEVVVLSANATASTPLPINLPVSSMSPVTMARLVSFVMRSDVASTLATVEFQTHGLWLELAVPPANATDVGARFENLQLVAPSMGTVATGAVPMITLAHEATWNDTSAGVVSLVDLDVRNTTTGVLVLGPDVVGTELSELSLEVRNVNISYATSPVISMLLTSRIVLRHTLLQNVHVHKCSVALGDVLTRAFTLEQVSVADVTAAADTGSYEHHAYASFAARSVTDVTENNSFVTRGSVSDVSFERVVGFDSSVLSLQGSSLDMQLNITSLVVRNCSAPLDIIVPDVLCTENSYVNVAHSDFSDSAESNGAGSSTSSSNGLGGGLRVRNPGVIAEESVRSSLNKLLVNIEHTRFAHNFGAIGALSLELPSAINTASVFIKRAAIAITNCTFLENEAVGKGGALNFETNVPMTLDITRCSMGYNRAATGGAVAASAIGTAVRQLVELHVQNTSVYANTASNSGGAFDVRGNGMVLVLRTVSLATVEEDNSAEWGHSHASGSRIHISDGRESSVGALINVGEETGVHLHDVTMYSGPSANVLRFSNAVITKSPAGSGTCPDQVAATLLNDTTLYCEQGLVASLVSEFAYQNTEEQCAVSLAVRCLPCPRGLYAVQASVIRSGVVQGTPCFECPEGALCTGSNVLPLRGFYLPQRTEGTPLLQRASEPIPFLPECPANYCDGQSRFASGGYATFDFISSCSRGRTGVLCGACEEGNVLVLDGSVRGATCVSERKQPGLCASLFNAWFVLFLLAFLVVVFTYVIFRFVRRGGVQSGFVRLCVHFANLWLTLMSSKPLVVANAQQALNGNLNAPSTSLTYDNGSSGGGGGADTGSASAAHESLGQSILAAFEFVQRAFSSAISMNFPHPRMCAPSGSILERSNGAFVVYAWPLSVVLAFALVSLLACLYMGTYRSMRRTWRAVSSGGSVFTQQSAARRTSAAAAAAAAAARAHATSGAGSEAHSGGALSASTSTSLPSAAMLPVLDGGGARARRRSGGSSGAKRATARTDDNDCDEEAEYDDASAADAGDNALLLGDDAGEHASDASSSHQLARAVARGASVNSAPRVLMRERDLDDDDDDDEEEEAAAEEAYDDIEQLVHGAQSLPMVLIDEESELRPRQREYGMFARELRPLRTAFAYRFVSTGAAVLELVFSVTLSTSLALLHCVPVPVLDAATGSWVSEYRLYLDGRERCLQRWQWGVLVLACVVCAVPALLELARKYVQRLRARLEAHTNALHGPDDADDFLAAHEHGSTYYGSNSSATRRGALSLARRTPHHSREYDARSGVPPRALGSSSVSSRVPRSAPPLRASVAKFVDNTKKRAPHEVDLSAPRPLLRAWHVAVLDAVQSPFNAGCGYWAAVLYFERFLVLLVANLVQEPSVRSAVLSALMAVFLYLDSVKRPFRVQDVRRLARASFWLLMLGALCVASSARLVSGSNALLPSIAPALFLVWIMFVVYYFVRSIVRSRQWARFGKMRGRRLYERILDFQ